MDIQTLKDKIIQLAIQGKLVPQDKNDEPIGNFIKRDKNNSKISEDEMPYEIPNNWEWIKIGDIGKIFNGNSINKKLKETKYSTVKEGYNYISTKDIDLKTSRINYQNELKIPYDEPKFKVAHKGAVVICSEGGSAGKKVGFIEEDVCFVNKLLAVEPIDCVYGKYIYYVYQSGYFFKEFSALVTGIIGGISLKNFKTILIPLPPLNEQKRIVEKIDFLFNLIEELENNKQNLLQNISEVKDKVLQLAIQGELVPQNENDEPASVLLEKIKKEKEKLKKENKLAREIKLPEVKELEDLYEIPKSWEWAYFQDITSCITCGVASTPKYVEEGKMFLSAKNVKPYKFMPEDHKFITEELFDKITKNAKPMKNDILLTRVGAGIGEATIIDQDMEFAIYVSLTLIKPIHKYINSKYILYFLNSSEGTKKCLINTFGKGTSQGNLNVNQVRKFMIPIPPLEEQNRIVEKIDSIFELCDNLEEEISK